MLRYLHVLPVTATTYGAARKRVSREIVSRVVAIVAVIVGLNKLRMSEPLYLAARTYILVVFIRAVCMVASVSARPAWLIPFVGAADVCEHIGQCRAANQLNHINNHRSKKRGWLAHNVTEQHTHRYPHSRTRAEQAVTQVGRRFRTRNNIIARVGHRNPS